MNRKLRFTYYRDDVLEFEWDSEQGTVIGKDAVAVLDACMTAYKIGGITVRPTYVPIKRNPLHHLEEMAAVLRGNFPMIQLSDEFRQAFLRIRPERIEPPVPEGEGWGPFYS